MISCFNASCGGDGLGGGQGNIGQSKVVYDTNPYEHRDTRKGGHLSRHFKVIGRDDDRDAVRGLLLAPGGGDNPSVVVIGGLGGLGKTTLARYIYHDDEVRGHFDAPVWFRVTENLHMLDLEMEVIKSTGGDPDAFEDIRVAVGGKRLLLVLDDVWEGSIEDLIRFRFSLSDALEGSKILVTTRSDRVAAGLRGDEGTLYNLKGLLDEDCWKLFKQKAFHVGRTETEQLVRIGREIVDKLQGVPLTGIAIGSLLEFNRDRSFWERVRDSEIWELPDVANKTLSALKLSYDHLPSHLQKCFEYCCLFPKSLKIDRKKVVELWMAEGLISTSAAGLPEDVGDGYFNDLLLRSFFQEEEEQFDDATSYTMHDLYHDLAQSIVGDEHLTVEAGRAISIPKGCRRLLLLCGWETSAISEVVYRPKRLETLVLLMRDSWVDTTHKCSMNEVPHDIFSRLRHLRLLDLSYIGVVKLPNSISKLKHLRYLNLSGTEIETLPESIGRLKNLCILKLESCGKLQKLPHSVKNLYRLKVLILDSCILLQELPEGIWNMCNLTHLQIDACLLLTHLPKGIGRLAGLQVLSQFPVNEEHGSSITELQYLNLKGKINIWNLGNLRNPMDARRVNMKEKPQLRQLELRWKLDFSGEKVNCIAGYSEDDGRDVLEGLQPHPNLEELLIAGYWGLNFPSWMAPSTIQSSLFNLVKVTLEFFGVCKALPPLGELPSLKAMKIMSFEALERLDGEFYGNGTFPSLEEFEISYLPALEEWVLPVDRRNLFPCLAHLEIDKCPRLRALPCISALKVLRVSRVSEDLLSSGSQGGWSLPSLKDLSISHCSASSGWDGLHSLPAVEKLAICHCTESSIPDAVKHLTSLRSLVINHFHNLSMLPLWLGNFTLLQSLKIHFCPKLANLPESVQWLPSLQNLEVRGDSNLWSQFMIGEEDWKDLHNITHVRNIQFQMFDDFDCH